MKNITEPYEGLYQVRVRRNNQIFSACFSAASEGNKEKALNKAIAWRDAVKKSKGGVDRVGQQTKPNKTTTVHGICSKIKKASQNRRYLYFSVHFKAEDGVPKNRDFSCGNIENITDKDVVRTFRVALLFRKTYEYHKQYSQGRKSAFIEGFNGWKSWSKNEIFRRFSDLGESVSELDQEIDALNLCELLFNAKDDSLS